MVLLHADNLINYCANSTTFKGYQGLYPLTGTLSSSFAGVIPPTTCVAVSSLNGATLERDPGRRLSRFFASFP